MAIDLSKLTDEQLEAYQSLLSRQQAPAAHYEGHWKVSPEAPPAPLAPPPTPGFWEEGGALHRFIQNSPLGPALNWHETLGKLGDYAQQQMQRYVNNPGPGTLPVVGDMAQNIVRAQDHPTPGNLVSSVPVVGPIARTAVQQAKSGDVAGALGTATNLAPIVWPAVTDAVAGAKALRTNNPDVSLANAVNANQAHTSFPEELPNIRANVKAAEPLTGKQIVDVPTALENTDAAMDANRTALETHKQVQRNLGTQFDTSVLKRAMIDAIPKGLKSRGAINPATGISEYDSAVAEINSLYPKRYVGVDQLFTQLEEANNRLHAFYSGKQGAQASKLVTNMGDTSILKAEGDAARKYLYDTMGADAAKLQSDWGEMNGFKHYIQDKVNPAFRQQPYNALDKVASVIDSPTSGGVKHGLIRSAVDTVVGVPKTIDGLIEDAFKNTQPANLPQPVVQTPFSTFGNPANPPGTGPQPAQLAAGPDEGINILPPGREPIITPQNPQQEAADALRTATDDGSVVRNRDAGYRSLNPAGAVPGDLNKMGPIPDDSGITGYDQAQEPFRVGFPPEAPLQISGSAPGETVETPRLGPNGYYRGENPRTQQVGATPAPPPVNILPTGPGAIGSSGTVPVTSSEAGIPLGRANGTGVDDFGRINRPPTLSRAERRAASLPPEEGVPEDVARANSMGTTQAADLGINPEVSTGPLTIAQQMAKAINAQNQR